jgi:hypothetical protein
MIPAFALLAALLAPLPAAAHEASFTWLPGAARAIPRTDSASRDAPVFEYAYGPAAYDTIGGEWGWFLVSTRKVSLRLGQYAMLPMENVESRRIFPPGELWRGMTGGSLSVCLDAVASRWLDGLELSLVASHESDHGTIERDPAPSDIPDGGGGQALTPDVAIRLRLTDAFTLVVRVQDRIYVHGALTHAPGGDIVMRYRLTEHLVPTIALFGEGLFPRSPEARNGCFLRALFGLAIRGRIGEATFFWSLEGGNGKGLDINTVELRVSGGVRYAPFAP